MSHDEQRTTQSQQLRVDIFTTLAIASLLSDDNRTIQKCAANLAKRAPGSLRKNTLLPLSTSDYAHSIIMESVTYPVIDKVIGTAEYDGEHYDVVANWRHSLEFTTNEVLGAVADILVQRGHCTGRVYVSVIDPVYRGMKADSAMLSDHATYCSQNYSGIQQEA